MLDVSCERHWMAVALQGSRSVTQLVSWNTVELLHCHIRDGLNVNQVTSHRKLQKMNTFKLIKPIDLFAKIIISFYLACHAIQVRSEQQRYINQEGFNL